MKNLLTVCGVGGLAVLVAGLALNAGEPAYAQHKSLLQRIDQLETEVAFLKLTIGVKTPDPAKVEHSILRPVSHCECNCIKCTCNRLQCDGECKCGCDDCECKAGCCEGEEKDYAWEYGVGG
jgi:hypothetical protein